MCQTTVLSVSAHAVRRRMVVVLATSQFSKDGDDLVLNSGVSVFDVLGIETRLIECGDCGRRHVWRSLQIMIDGDIVTIDEAVKWWPRSAAWRIVEAPWRSCQDRKMLRRKIKSLVKLSRETEAELAQVEMN